MNGSQTKEIFHQLEFKLQRFSHLAERLVAEQGLAWLRIAILVGVFAAAIVFGLVSAKLDPLYALILSAAPFLLVGLQMLLKRPELIPTTILLISLFVPFSLPTGTGSRLVMSLLATTMFAGLWLLHMIVTKNFSLVPSSVNLPTLAFMAVTLISVVWSIVFRDPLVYTPGSFIVVQIASALVMVMLPGAMLMVGNFIHTLKPLTWMAGVMLAAGALAAAAYILNLPQPVKTDGLFNLWVIGLAFGIAIFMHSLSWQWRLALLALAGAFFYRSFFLNISWLAGWLPGLAALGVLTWMRSKKLAFVFLLIMVAIVLTDVNYFLGRVIQNEAAESGYTRLAAWESNWGITRDHLLLGTGPAGYAVYYMSYFPDSAMATHSNYIDILAQTGIIGLGLCLWLFGAVAYKGYRLSRRLKGRGDLPEALANVSFAGTVACILIMAFGDWLFPFAYTQTIAGFDYAVVNWLFMGMILTLEQIFRREAAQEPTAPRLARAPFSAGSQA